MAKDPDYGWRAERNLWLLIVILLVAIFVTALWQYLL
jgi:hypothetical protein